jgi:hypothetical protein
MNFAPLASAILAATLSAAAAAQDSDIAVAELGEVRPLEVSAGGGLPDTVWSSTQAAALRAVLQTLPRSADANWSDQPSARLALSALLTGGAPPQTSEAEATQLAVLRADRVLAAGGARPAFNLLSRTPGLNEYPALSALYVETAFALGEAGDACRAANALLDGRDTAYWLRVRATCLVFDGNIPAGELTAELARAQSANDNFDSLFDALTLGLGLPSDVAPRSGLQLAIAEAIAPETRIGVAETAPSWVKQAAERTGPPISLPQTLPEALEAAVALEGADRRAALGALIQQELDRTIAAEALAIRLSDAAEADDFVAAARAYGPEVARLPITADTLAHGRLFVLAALGADDVVAARSWRDGLMEGPPAPPQPQPQSPAQAQPDGAPAALTAPPGFENRDGGVEPPWEPPAPAIMVELDFASAIASGRIEGDGFAALLAARIENADTSRLCQAAALAALGADDGGQMRTAMTGLERAEGVPAPVVAPGLLAAAAGALGESQLHAAALLQANPRDPEACATAAAILNQAGLKGQALRWVLEITLEDAV